MRIKELTKDQLREIYPDASPRFVSDAEAEAFKRGEWTNGLTDRLLATRAALLEVIERKPKFCDADTTLSNLDRLNEWVQELKTLASRIRKGE
jgi:hypothetical protein